MGFLYGNIITHVPRSQFQFDKIYSTRSEMEQQQSMDNVRPLRYILIDYNHNDAGYQSNLNIDQERYGLKNGDTITYAVNYDQTVWQKQYIHGEDDSLSLKYIAIDRLHSVLPIFETYSPKDQALLTFQDVNAFPLTLEHIPDETYTGINDVTGQIQTWDSYAGFGTDELNKDPNPITGTAELNEIPQETKNYNTETLVFPLK